jgi:hypothetical protein
LHTAQELFRSFNTFDAFDFSHFLKIRITFYLVKNENSENFLHTVNTRPVGKEVLKKFLNWIIVADGNSG